MSLLNPNVPCSRSAGTGSGPALCPSHTGPPLVSRELLGRNLCGPSHGPPAVATCSGLMLLLIATLSGTLSVQHPWRWQSQSGQAPSSGSAPQDPALCPSHHTAVWIESLCKEFCMVPNIANPKCWHAVLFSSTLLQ